VAKLRKVTYILSYHFVKRCANELKYEMGYRIAA